MRYLALIFSGKEDRVDKERLLDSFEVEGANALDARAMAANAYTARVKPENRPADFWVLIKPQPNAK